MEEIVPAQQGDAARAQPGDYGRLAADNGARRGPAQRPNLLSFERCPGGLQVAGVRGGNTDRGALGRTDVRSKVYPCMCRHR